MKLTINDFEGYDNSCETIKKIKLWIENKGGSFDMKELISEFEKEHYSFKTEVIRYIKPDYLKEYLDEFFENLYEEKRNSVMNIYEEEPKYKKIDDLRLLILYDGFKHDGTNTFQQSTNIWVMFQQYYYIINDTNSQNNKEYFCKKLYSEPLTQEEIKSIVNKLTKKLLEDTKASIKKNE